MYKTNFVDHEQKARQLWVTFEVKNDWWHCDEDGRGRNYQIHIAAEFQNYIDEFKPNIENVAKVLGIIDEFTESW